MGQIVTKCRFFPLALLTVASRISIYSRAQSNSQEKKAQRENREMLFIFGMLGLGILGASAGMTVFQLVRNFSS